MGSLLVGLVAAVTGGMFVFLASRPAEHKGATRAHATPVHQVENVEEPRPQRTPRRLRLPAAPRPAVPAGAEVHTPLGAAVRLGGLLVLAGAFCAGMLAIVLALGVTVLVHSLR
jgi:hypothetical protein